ncbi:MAG: hypothetical protein JXB25_11565 [Deltaproteobacteria bacterium]|nr:hypothetical protein [Deltaproteobacteria bacterium]
MNKITHYGVFLCLLFAIVTEWNDIAKNKPAAIFCLLAALFYLLSIVSTINDTHFPDKETNRKTRFLQRRQSRRNANAGLLFTLMFVLLWVPYSESMMILSICCAFFFLIVHLATLSLSYWQEKVKQELIRRKEG